MAPRFLVSVAIGALVACSSPPTQLLVRVSSDLDVPAELSRVDVDVTGPHGATVSFDLTRTSLPLSFAVVPTAGTPRTVTITVRGFDATSALVVSQVRTVEFVSGTSQTVEFGLSRSCLSRMCGAETTCVEGTCVPLTRPDAGVPVDSSIDTGARDDAAADTLTRDGDRASTDAAPCADDCVAATVVTDTERPEYLELVVAGETPHLAWPLPFATRHFLREPSSAWRSGEIPSFGRNLEAAPDGEAMVYAVGVQVVSPSESRTMFSVWVPSSAHWNMSPGTTSHAEADPYLAGGAFPSSYALFTSTGVLRALSSRGNSSVLTTAEVTRGRYVYRQSPSEMHHAVYYGSGPMGRGVYVITMDLSVSVNEQHYLTMRDVPFTLVLTPRPCVVFVDLGELRRSCREAANRWTVSTIRAAAEPARLAAETDSTGREHILLAEGNTLTYLRPNATGWAEIPLSARLHSGDRPFDISISRGRVVHVAFTTSADVRHMTFDP